jgi:hypothetical protein
MYKVGKHCWSSQKCGCQLAQHVWSEIEGKNDYIFYQGRSPYDRIVSLYAGHFVDINGVMWWNRGSPSTLNMSPEERGVSIANRDPRSLFNFSDSSVSSYSFEKFIFDVLDKKMTEGGDPHVRCQTVGFPKTKFDDVLLLNQVPEAYSGVSNKIGVEIEFDFQELKKDKGVVTPNKHITPKFDMNNIDAAKITPEQWWEYGAFPSDYSCFYKSKSVKDRILDLYELDFEFFKEYDIYFDL